MGLDQRFHEYFRALDRAGGRDYCYLCRRTPAEVKNFFGFDEDGTPFDAEDLGLEDVVLDRLDVMSYRGLRPICAVCQLNLDAIFILGEDEILKKVQEEMLEKRDELWPPGRHD
ncbi:MAG: hypothetical protein ACI8X5_000474 [Planctomycetota bacterium]